MTSVVHPSHPDHRMWALAKASTANLRAIQNADGSIEPEHHEDARVIVEELISCLPALSQAAPATAEHITAAGRDLHKWAQDGFGTPDFRCALEALRPEQHRTDGTPLVTLLNMYTPNNSLDRRLELAAFRVVWPEQLDQAASAGGRNEVFVPLHLEDGTGGIDSECAVLFPETVTLDKKQGAAPNYFGGIICSTEARRFTATTMSMADRVGLNIPEGLQGRLRNTSAMTSVFALWDFTHDRIHSIGSLPFDPFMIRKKAPYWAYSLEELRCDVAAYCALRSDLAGIDGAAEAAVAIILDRCLRFPLTGGRERNYDGLAGQILFGWLHSRGAAEFRDHTLSISWGPVLDEVMIDLHNQLERIYRESVRGSRSRMWVGEHAFINSVVPARMDSAVVQAVMNSNIPEEPVELIALAHPDEFPLSQFHMTLARL
jgi:hypothetical protein